METQSYNMQLVTISQYTCIPMQSNDVIHNDIIMTCNYDAIMI